LTTLRIDWRLTIGTAVLAAGAAAMMFNRVFRTQEDPEGDERRRRLELNQIGRIVEGLVVDVVETVGVPVAAEPASTGRLSRRKPVIAEAAAAVTRRLVRYSYSISGVTYETAQDVTGLEERLCIERLAAGQPASVKYDPANPSNSILVADDWSGLH